ncbi:MAG: hypothetical protein GYA57_02755, partial [Myxococcales bacterium]|nr:hypothetical protein [Myxococcales bacterium]
MPGCPGRSALLPVFLVLSACDGGTTTPPTCGPNACNEAVGGGTCDDSTGRAVCTCRAGYAGTTCRDCADGYVARDGACFPATCGADSCNESHGGGTCDASSGTVVCTCREGYLGPTCRSCAAGWHPDGSGGCARDARTACEPLPGGSTSDVQAPVLRATLPASWDENWLASPAVADPDGDGANEIVAARHSVLYVWNADGTRRWRAAWGHDASDPEDHGSTRMYASPAVGDFDHDGDLEIAAGAHTDDDGTNLAVWDHTGALLPGWPTAFGDTEIRALAAGDLDGDGFAEIVVNKTSDGPTTAVFELDGTLRPGWPQVNHATCDPPPPAEACWDFGGYGQNVGLADLDGDGRLDVISTYDAIGFGLFHDDGSPFPTAPGFADRVVTAVEAYHDLALSQQGWGNGDRSEFTDSPPAAADLDGDGHLELVLVGDHEHSESTTNRGNTFWVLRPDLTRPPGWDPPIDSDPPVVYDADLGANILPVQPAPSLGNLDEDDRIEIVAPSYDGYLYAFDADGTRQWRFPFGRTADPFTGGSEALIADLNGDGVPEVTFCTWSSGAPREPDAPAHLVILNNNGVELQRVELFGRGSMAAPTLADLDGDHDLELIV